MKHYLFRLCAGLMMATAASAVDLKRCTIVTDSRDAALVSKMAVTLSEDIRRVTGTQPMVGTAAKGGPAVILSTVDRLPALCPDVSADDIRG